MKAITKATMLEILKGRKDNLEYTRRVYKDNLDIVSQLDKQIRAVDEALEELRKEETDD